MATKAQTKTDAVEILKQDHEKVKSLFRKFSETGDGALKTRQRLAEQIFEELELHTRVEEEIFYPALRKATNEEGVELLDEAEEEHHVVDLIIAELKQMEPSHEHFAAKMTVLCENVEHHIQEEEGEMLPDAEKRIGDQMESLGQQIMEMKRSAKLSA